MPDSLFGKIIILSDFDGTFYDGNSRNVPPNNLDAVEYFKDHGGYFSLSTGRLPSVLQKVYPGFRNIVNIPLIMSNGALLVDNKSGEILSEAPMNSDIGLRIIRDVTNSFSKKITDWAVYDERGEINHKPDQKILVHCKFFYKMWFNAADVSDSILIRDYLIENYSEEANIFRSWSSCTEVVSKSASKDKMIQKIKKIAASVSPQHFRPDEFTVFAIGDFENDIPLLHAADVAFCPENALDSVKTVCKRILCRESEGAVAQLINIIDKTVKDGKLK